MGKTPSSQCRGLKLDPCLGNEDPTCKVAKKKKKRKKRKAIIALTLCSNVRQLDVSHRAQHLI